MPTTRVLLLCLLASRLVAQMAPAPITLVQAVEEAAANYPAVRASLERVNAAAAAITLARTAWLPHADATTQLNRASHNNIFGLLLPGTGLPSISGPVLRTNSLANVWGSAVGVTAQWEPLDFGLRQANVQVAQAGRDSAQAQVAVARFEASAAAADAYLTLLAAQQTVRAAQAGVERALVLSELVAALVRAELRPGAEASRTRAEQVIAANQLIAAEQAVEVARAALSQVVGVPPGAIQPVAGRLLDAPPEVAMSASAGALHPAAAAQLVLVDEVKARERSLDRSWYPKLSLQAATYARGSGIQPDGATGNAASGLGPNIQNWALGMSVTFPLTDLPGLKARKQIEHHHELAQQARYEQTLREVDAQTAKARAMLAGARRIEANAPVELEAARATEAQATARYRSGLGTLLEVAEAQRLRTQAEIDGSLAHLAVWRGLLAVTVAQGDLAAFLQQVQ